jgi:hypothetical protein
LEIRRPKDQILSVSSFGCHRLRGYRWVDANDAAAVAAMQKKVPQSVAECFDLSRTPRLAASRTYLDVHRLARCHGCLGFGLSLV